MAIDCHEHALRELKQTPLFREVYVVVCSPEYRDRFRPAVPAGLDACTILSCDKVGAWWHRFLSALPEEQRPQLNQLMAVSHIRAMVNAAVHGLGVALVPQYCVLEELETGRLVSLFPGHPSPWRTGSASTRSAPRADREKQRLFTSFLQDLTPEEFGAVRASAR